MRLGLGCVALALLAGALGAEPDFALQDGDRVMVCGADFEQQLALLHALETFVATRFPDRRVAFAPSARLLRDLLVFHPTVLALLPGAFEAGVLEQVQAADPGIRVTILQPDAALAPALLQAWHAPATVTEVEVNATGKSLALAVNATVRDLSIDRFIFWTQTDRALPLAAGSGLPVSLNQQLLRVRGLPESRYRLLIDERTVGAFFRDQYDAGINLALLPTPMALQSAQLKQIIADYDGIHLARWLGWQSSERGTPLWTARMSALDEMEGALLESLRTAARPESHEFELQPEVPLP